MRLKTVREANIKNKKVLLRCGFDVPFNKIGKIEDDERIRQSLPTIEYLIKNKAKIIILSHNGRPEGKYMKKLGMTEVVRRLSILLNRKVLFADDCLGQKVKIAVNKLKPGQILLLENLRFHKAEEKNDPVFSRRLASLGEVYVNDAFANCHRKHASMVGITKFLPSFAGLLVEREVKTLTRVIEKPKRPFVAIVGGVKISDKLAAIINLIKKVDTIILGGALANTILKAKGIQVGKSLIERKMLFQVKKLDLTNIKIKIPVDVVVAKSKTNKAKATIRPVGNVKLDESILDIGTDTITLYKGIIKKAKQIVWAGPMGLFEINKFSNGCKNISHAVATSHAFKVVGGGDTNHVLEKYKLKDKIDFISTGGSAMLEFLEGKTLPAIKPLIR